MRRDEIYFAKINVNARIPSKEIEDAGYDIYACFDEENLVINPNESVMVPTGIVSAFSSEYMFLLEERSSTGVRDIKRNAGVIDSGFRGEWKAILYNANKKPIVITKETNKDILEVLEDDYIVYPYDKAIVQALLIPVPMVKVKEKTYSELLMIDSKRGSGMLGSSGK